MPAMGPMKRVVLWLVALNACGVVALAGFIWPRLYGPAQSGFFGEIAFAIVPLVAVMLLSLPLLRSVRGVASNTGQSLRTVLFSVTPAAVGISSLGAVELSTVDQTISSWNFFIFIHLGYGGLLLLCVMTVHCSSGLFSQQISHRYDRMLTWTDAIVKGIFVAWLPTFVCFLFSVLIFWYLYPVAVLATAAHFALLYRAIGKVEATPEASGEAEAAGG